MKSLKINTILNMIKTCSNIIFPLITFPYISRVLMTENVGKVNFGDSYVSYFSLIASLGITTYAIRECAKGFSDFFYKFMYYRISLCSVVFVINYIQKIRCV